MEALCAHCRSTIRSFFPAFSRRRLGGTRLTTFSIRRRQHGLRTKTHFCTYRIVITSIRRVCSREGEHHERYRGDYTIRMARENFKNELVYLDVSIGKKPAQRITIELFSSVAPRSCKNFRLLCTYVADTRREKNHEGHDSLIPVHRVCRVCRSF